MSFMIVCVRSGQTVVKNVLRTVGYIDVGDNFKMMMTVLANLVTNIYHILTLASGTNIQKMSPRSKFGHQHPKSLPLPDSVDKNAFLCLLKLPVLNKKG